MSIGRRSAANMQRWRKAVYRRDNEVCVACAVMWGPNAMSSQLTLQHRVGRGMGGSARFDETPAGLITFCAGHNLAETAEAKFARYCLEMGWSVPRWAFDNGWSLDIVPVRYFDGWFLLEGTERVPMDDKLAAERMLEIYGPDF